MYTFLNQKYGLKQLIIEYASAIISGIKEYQREDNEVCLFGKILRNEVDEEFRFVQVHVRETVYSLLRGLVKEKMAMKGEGEVSRIQEEICLDRVGLDQSYWLRIIERMYEEQDVEVLERSIREFSQQR